MKNSKIGVIGAGNVGQTLAGYLSSINYDVYLYSRGRERVDDILKCGKKILLRGDNITEATVECVTDDIEYVVSQCDILFITTPANSHYDIAKRISKSIRCGQVIMLVPGRTLGSYKFYKSLQESGCIKDVTIAEASTVFFACRLVENGIVEVYSRKKYVEATVLSHFSHNILIDEIKKMFPEMVMVDSVFQTGLSNIGMVFHPAPFLFNLSRVDNCITFKYYREGISPIVAKYIEGIDEERILIGEKLGIKVESAMEWLKRTYNAEGNNLHECIQNTKAYENVLAPQSIYSRYIYEDVSTGLVTLCELGEYFGIRLCYSEMIIQLASLLYQQDFYENVQHIMPEDVEKILEMEKKQYGYSTITRRHSTLL